MGPVIATFYICRALAFGSMCNLYTASEPPRHYVVFEHTCGYYVLNDGVANLYCGARE